MTQPTDTTGDTEHETEAAPTQRPLRVAFGVLITCTVAVAAVSFALSFYGLNDYGRSVMRLPVWLSPLVPIGVDLFSLCGIAATYMLRSARIPIRVYAWCVFLVPTGLSVAGNLAHAVHRHLITAGWAGAAVVPVILALATHLVVVVRRHLENDDATGNEPASGAVSAEPLSAQVNGSPAMSNNGHSPDNILDTTSDTAQMRAIALLLNGKPVPEVAAAVGKDRRTVQAWVDRLHQQALPRRRGARRPPNDPA